ncbi:DMT family transporter [Thermobifida cellulosilytica]|uniref:DMT family transporter n=1 Tax=Thermobifida cellulosilytica TaxID=144786 RepID=UPI0018DCD033|nr:DMT family transporter [Thermobifida cellulosilytica]
MTGAIIAAVLGAVAFAAGAAVQERGILLSAPPRECGQVRLLRYLVRSPVWLAGTALSGAALAAHCWALTQAPLTVVQPIGVSGLLCAVVVSAVLHRRRLTRTEVAGCLAVTFGLIVLVAMLSGHAGPVEPRPQAEWILAAATGAVIVIGVVVSRFLPGALRAWTLALVGGVSFATLSALVKVIGLAVLDDPVAVFQPLTPVALAIGACGALLVQNAYRTEHFALAYATLLISDPLMAVLIGTLLLDESLPTQALPVAVMTLSTLVIVWGTVTLARTSAAREKTAAQAASGPAGGTPRPAAEPDGAEPDDTGRADERPGSTPRPSERTPEGRSVPEGLGGQGDLGLGGPAVTLVGDGDSVSGTV